MCKSKAQGGKRCKKTKAQKSAINARRRARYHEKKEGADNGRSNSAGAGSISASAGVEQGVNGRGTSATGSTVDGRGHSDGSGPQSSINVLGQNVRVVATHNPPTERAEQLRALGKSTPDLHEVAPEDTGAFYDKIMKLQEGNKWHASVYVYPKEEYKDMRVFLASDGESGIAMKSDGDIVSVFSSPIAKDRQSANSMIATVVSLGGKKLDCFDTVLPKIYAQEGFVETGRDTWAEEYKPEGWDYETYKGFNNGCPDVVYMEYRADAVGGSYTSPNR